jgi:hypothetical protein
MRTKTILTFFLPGLLGSFNAQTLDCKKFKKGTFNTKQVPDFELRGEDKDDSDKLL